MKLNIYPGNPESLPVRFVWGSNPLAYFVDAASIREKTNPLTSISSFLSDTNQYLLNAQNRLVAALALGYSGDGVSNTNDVLTEIVEARADIVAAMSRDATTLAGASAIQADVENAVEHATVAMSFIQGSYTVFDIFEDEGTISHSDELVYREALFCAEVCAEEINECLALAENLVTIRSGGSGEMWRRAFAVEYLDLSKRNFLIVLPYETKVKRERIINPSFSRKHSALYGQSFSSLLPDHRREPSAGSERVYSEFSGHFRIDDTAQVVRYFPEVSNGKIVSIVPHRNIETVRKGTVEALWRVSYVWISNIKKKKTSQPFSAYTSGALPLIPVEDDYDIKVVSREVSSNAGAPFNQNGTTVQSEPFNSPLIDDNQRVISSRLSAQTISVGTAVIFYWSGHSEAEVVCFNEDGSSSTLLSLDVSPPEITGSLADLTLSVFSETVSFLTSTKNGVAYVGHSKVTYTGVRNNSNGTIGSVSRVGLVGVMGTDGLSIEVDVTSQIADGRSLDVIGAYAESPSRYCVVYVVGQTFGGLSEPEVRCISNHGSGLFGAVSLGSAYYALSPNAFHYNNLGVLAVVSFRLMIGNSVVSGYSFLPAAGPSIPPPSWLRWTPDNFYILVSGHGSVRLFTAAGVLVSGPGMFWGAKTVKITSKPLKAPVVTAESTTRTYEFLILTLGRLFETDTDMNTPELITLKLVVTEPVSGPITQVISLTSQKYPDGGSSLGPYLEDTPREVFMCDTV